MTEPKMVPETNLIALKESHAKTVEDLKTTHATELSTAGTEHGEKSAAFESKAKTTEGELTRLRADNSRLEEAGKTHASTVEERDGLKTEITESKRTLATAEEGLRTNLADQLTAGYGIPESAVKDKTSTELKQVLEILKAAKKPNSNNYTSGGGSGGSESQQTGREKIVAGIEGNELRRM